MKLSKSLLWLSSLAGLLALAAACAGLFYQDGPGAFTFISLHGQALQMYGRGVYHNDTLVSAATFIGTDAVTIFGMVPLLIYALWQRGSLRGGLLLVSALGFFLYNSAHMALAVAYNNLFLLYVAFFSASLFAFLLAFTSIDRAALAARLSPRAPRRRPAVFLMISGAVLALVWLSDILPALFSGGVPGGLGSSTVPVTYVIDLAVFMPATMLAGFLLLRRPQDGLGYLLAAILLVFCAVAGIVVIAQTAASILLGAPLTPAVAAVFVLPFVLMAGFAIWFTVGMMQELGVSV